MNKIKCQNDRATLSPEIQTSLNSLNWEQQPKQVFIQLG